MRLYFITFLLFVSGNLFAQRDTSIQAPFVGLTHSISALHGNTYLDYATVAQLTGSYQCSVFPRNRQLPFFAFASASYSQHRVTMFNRQNALAVGEPRDLEGGDFSLLFGFGVSTVRLPRPDDVRFVPNISIAYLPLAYNEYFKVPLSVQVFLGFRFGKRILLGPSFDYLVPNRPRYGISLTRT